MAVTSTIPKGAVLAGKYRVERELGRGGMAAVYEATNIDIDKRVAIKLLAGHLAASQTVVERFLREARAVSQIRSPHICEVYDSGRIEDGTPFLVLELLEGESLYDAMCRDRQMSPQVTLAIILQVAKGLAKAHEAGIVHRDLKPENIFLTVDGDGHLLVKILDFGLAKFYDPVNPGGPTRARLTREGAVFGTPAYMSPEQVRGQAAADTRADLWALACITYECFTGTTVWSTEDGVAMTFAQIATAPLPDPRKWRPDLPDSFTRWFDKALDRDIGQRFQNVQDFADELVVAFDYRASAGGLDAGLISRITHQAAHAPDSETITERARRKTMEARVREREDRLAPRPAPPPYSTPRVPPHPPQPSASPSPVEVNREPPLLVPTVPPPRSRTGLRVMLSLLLLLSIGAAVVVVGFDGPTRPAEAKRFGPSAARMVQSEPPEASGFRYVAKHPFLPLVREAQALIAQGEHDRALAILRRVYEQHRHGMIRNLMDQVQVAVVARTSDAPCQVNGYSRPRRYDLLSQDTEPVDAGPPSIVLGLKHPVIAWNDPHDGQRRAYAVAMDESLRNRMLPVDLTPEGKHVFTPTLLPVAQRFLAVYWDATGGSPGVFVRWLDANAIIAAPPVAVTEKRPGAYQAVAARQGEGFVVAWIDQIDNDSSDVFYRLYDGDAKPRGEAVRVTDFLQKGRDPTRAHDIQVSATKDTVYLAYTVVRSSMQEIRFSAVPVDTKPPGLEPLEGKEAEERTLVDEVVLTARGERADAPSLACTEEGCFVAWHQVGNDGAGVAFLDAKTGARQWHKRFTGSGKKPAIGASPAGELRLAWYEGGRLTTAPLGREGVGPESKVARVVGDQPPPVLAAGPERGQWYIAWLDYESGHREPYALRMVCQ